MLLGRLFANQVDLPDMAEGVDPRALPSGGGVCALTTADDELVQLLCGQSLRRVLALRLDPRRQGASGKRAELSAVARRAWWQPTYSTFETDLVYLRVARQLLGTGYRKQLGFGPVWYACIRMADAFPQWVVSDAPFGAGVTAGGPFVTRRRCAAFVADLEDLYDLCRYPDVLRQAPHGERCSYFDMGKCPAPCDGTIGMTGYREMLARSVQFATESGDVLVADLRERMAQAAGKLDFEGARVCRDALQRAEAAQKTDGRFAQSPAIMRFVVVQRGAGTSMLRPFYFNSGRIETGADVHLKELPSAVAAWARRDWSSDNAELANAVLRRDQVALVCHYIGKGDKAPGVYLNWTELRNAQAAAERIAAGFARARRAPG